MVCEWPENIHSSPNSLIAHEHVEDYYRLWHIASLEIAIFDDDAWIFWSIETTTLLILGRYIESSQKHEFLSIPFDRVPMKLVPGIIVDLTSYKADDRPTPIAFVIEIDTRYSKIYLMCRQPYAGRHHSSPRFRYDILA